MNKYGSAAESSRRPAQRRYRGPGPEAGGLRLRGGSINLAAVHAASHDPVRTLYRTIVVFGAVGIVIMAVGLVEFLHFEPPGQTAGPAARIVGVYQYDSTSKKTSGADQSSFARDQQFAAVVDWSSIPPGTTVDARWYDSFQVVVGSVGPGTPAQLAEQTTVPVNVPKALKYDLPGQYIFVVERLSGGLPVEVLSRRIVEVRR